MKENRQSQEQNESIDNLYEEILKTKKLDNLAEFNTKLKEINQKIGSMRLSILQKFSVLFYSYYKHFSQNDQKKLFELATFMISSWKNKSILALLHEEIRAHFSVELKNSKVFSLEATKNDCLEICYIV